MLDPNFRRTVLFVSEHDPNDGALGVIINRPLDRQVADVVTDIPPAGLADVPVFLGGTVGKNQLMAPPPAKKTWSHFVRSWVMRAGEQASLKVN